MPAAVAEFLEADLVGGSEGIGPGPERRLRTMRLPVQFLINLTHQTEGVLVIAEPDVKSVFLDPAIDPAAAGSLAPETPTAFVDGDRLEPVLPPGLAQAPGGGETRNASAEDRHLLPGGTHQEEAATRAAACFASGYSIDTAASSAARASPATFGRSSGAR